MHKSKILVDLPSAETERRKGPLEWLRSLFGAQLDLRSGKEELTVGALWLVEGLVEAFAAAGVHDVISFLVDKQAVYLDADEIPDDLPKVIGAAQVAGVLERSFTEMHLVLAHRTGALHTIIDCTIKNGVLLGEAEMTVSLSARLRELQVQPGETAPHYAERVRAFAQSTDALEPTRRELDALTEKLSNELSVVLVGARVTREPATTRLVRPEGRQIGRFRRLGFGDGVQAPKYRAVPTTQRHGAYHDPFYYHYYDPYYDLTTYLMLDAMMHHHAWGSPHLHVVDPAGHHLFSGDAPPTSTDAAAAWAGAGAVSFSESGALEVDHSIAPDIGSGSPGADSGDPHRATWFEELASSGAEALSSDGGSASDPDSRYSSSSYEASSSDYSSSSSSDSSSSSSSCGSSCSSASSCGSSCSSSSSSD